MTDFKKRYLIKPLTVLFLFFCLILLNVVIASTANHFLPSITDGNNNTKECGSYQGRTLRKGPTKGGCYYTDQNKKIIYVDKRLCDC